VNLRQEQKKDRDAYLEESRRLLMQLWRQGKEEMRVHLRDTDMGG
jgi:hypothetical protein